MQYFRLPDLGEGLADAEIISWSVKPGMTVEKGTILLSVETAKAVVEIPSPCPGQIAAVFGAPGQIIRVGEALVEFKVTDTIEASRADAGSIVGRLNQADSAPILAEDNFIIGAAEPSQEKGRPGGEVLRGVRRAMAQNLGAAHSQVAKVTILEDADIHLWPNGTDTTIRLVCGIAAAVKAEPILNSWFSGHSLRVNTLAQIDLGIAIDTPDGLFVPVLRDIANRGKTDLRRGINRLIRDVLSRKIPAGEMKNPTITLSHFGTIAGKYGDPVIVPPTVCIVGAGKIRQAVVPHEGQPAIHRILPVSVSFDHRVITGGEAARFVKALIAALEFAEAG